MPDANANRRPDQDPPRGGDPGGHAGRTEGQRDQPATSRVMGLTFRDFRDDDSLRVCILRAAGEKFFCPGWDLKAAAEGDAVDGDYGVGGFGGLQELPNLNKPVIAAVQGICCGGGLELALSADLILCSTNATFALPEIRSGTVADAASIKLPKRIPYHVAMDLLLTGPLVRRRGGASLGPDQGNLRAGGLLPKARPGSWRAFWKAARRWSTPRSRKWCARPRNMRFQDALNRITKRQMPTVDRLYSIARISWRARRPLPKSAIRSKEGARPMRMASGVMPLVDENAKQMFCFRSRSG
jgi:crotonobetainyl-CoA hydratase